MNRLIFLTTLLSLLVNCKSDKCNSTETFFDKIPLVTELVECKKKKDLPLLAVIGAANSRSQTTASASSSACPAKGSLSNPSPVSGATVTLSGANCTNTALQSAVTSGGNITLNCNSPIPITSEITVPSNVSVFITGTNGSGTGGKVVLDGGGASRIFFGNSSSTIIVKNLQFQNGKSKATVGTGSTAADKNAGGAILSGYKGTLTVIDSIFLNNAGGTVGTTSEEGGGAIYSKSFGKLTIVNSYFQGNTGGLGGAINNLLSKLTIIDSTFKANSALVDTTSGSGYGGAIYTDGAGLGGDNGATNRPDLNPPTGLGNMTICRTYFLENTGKGQGGGAFLFIYTPDVLTLDNVVFERNSVIKNGVGDALGGGLRIGNGDAFISNSYFVDNVAKSQAGGLWKGEVGTITITNTTFVNNFAVENGGNTAVSLAARTDSGGICGAVNGSDIKYTNVTMINNHAGFMSGALCGTRATITKSIIAYNTAYNSGNSWKKGQNCSGTTQPTSGGSNFEFPNKNTSDTTSDNTTCVNTTIADPLYQSSSSFSYTNSVVTTIPIPNINSCSTSIGYGDNSSFIKSIPLQTSSQATGLGASCP
ncbi:MAG TPA: hypothetical protein PLX69_21655 [Leptospiraceae bacterium]|nr:hypothetical protein [Leptospiraceae bacterium]HRG77179.1 hypothetical protein [Leptospiraceae bacterium]